MAAIPAEGLLRQIGRPILSALNFIGEVWFILVDVFRQLFSGHFEVRETIDQMAFIGAASVPIVTLTTFFSGAVLSLYLTQFLIQFGAVSFVGATVGVSISREIGPVLGGIMVAARCGSAMAAQIGTMAVTEQVDALRMLSVHPTKYLVIPRFVASVLMLPVLVLVGIYSGIFGGWVVAVLRGVPSGAYSQSIQQYVKLSDFTGGMAKAPVFGAIVVLVACQQGLRAKDGAVGVGRATTNTVVIAMVLIYIANFFLAQVLF